MKESQVIDALAAEHERKKRAEMEDKEAADRIAEDIMTAEAEVVRLRE